MSIKQKILTFLLAVTLVFLIANYLSIPTLADHATCSSGFCRCECSGYNCICSAGGGSCSCDCVISKDDCDFIFIF
jgi:hypothetical protein